MRLAKTLRESRLVRRLLLLAIVAFLVLKTGYLLGYSTAESTYSSRLESISNPDTLCSNLGWQAYHAQTPRPRRVYDLFMVNTELDWLEIRLNTTYNSVDYFVIVESPLTFTSLKKPLYVRDAWDRLKAYHDKIIYHVVEFPAAFQAKVTWDVEDWVRNSMFAQVFDGYDTIARPDKDHDPRILQKGDVLVVSDVDELVRPGVLDALRKCHFPRRLTLWSHFYYYSYQFRVAGDGWPFPQATYFSGDKSSTILPGNLRTGDGGNPFIRELYEKKDLRNAGWHCSTCFNRLEIVLNKMASFSHTSMNHAEHRDKHRIVDRVRNGKDIWDREAVKLNRVSVGSDSDIPSFVSMHTERFQYLVDRDNEFAGFIDYEDA